MFRLENWDDRKTLPYRVTFKDNGKLESWSGLIKANPVDRNTVTLATLSCMKDMAFPNQYVEQNVIAQQPDLVYFAGDQLYEGNGGYGIVRAYSMADVPRATLNYLQKYWIFGWSFRDLMKDVPSLIVPDDHDVFHGNIWGLGGAPVPEGGNRGADGGYEMHPEWVRMVERTQTSNIPDPIDPRPVLQDIGVYFTDVNVGGVSFAVIEDRKFKSGPTQARDMATLEGRADHIRDPNIDPLSLDKPGLQLLGERQETFLESWAGDWRGVKMKAVLSQSPFCAVATHHGGGDEKNILLADLDSNGWPQSGRNRALRSIRKKPMPSWFMAISIWQLLFTKASTIGMTLALPLQLLAFVMATQGCGHPNKRERTRDWVLLIIRESFMTVLKTKSLFGQLRIDTINGNQSLCQRNRTRPLIC